MGMRLRKMHRVMTFTQSRLLQPYIENLHKRRMAAKDAFSKSFFLMINSFLVESCLIFGSEQKLSVQDLKTCEKYLNSPLFKSFHSVNDHFALYKMHIPNLI